MRNFIATLLTAVSAFVRQRRTEAGVTAVEYGLIVAVGIAALAPTLYAAHVAFEHKYECTKSSVEGVRPVPADCR